MCIMMQRGGTCVRMVMQRRRNGNSDDDAEMRNKRAPGDVAMGARRHRDRGMAMHRQGRACAWRDAQAQVCALLFRDEAQTCAWICKDGA